MFGRTVVLVTCHAIALYHVTCVSQSCELSAMYFKINFTVEAVVTSPH